MTIRPGARLGPYEITAPLGSGGMGEVYRATDTSLKRQVAIKVLPQLAAGDSDRLSRLQREAEMLAALNHPNIAQIFGLEKSDGDTALVMELVEGPTLAEIITASGLTIDDALAIARQIGDALEAAHAQGIVHRDLKPANIKVRPDGTVKVLDFGLAKAFSADASSPELTKSPTLSLGATQAGVILGTAAYMSPEQARGKAVDKRTDVWAYGCVLYEMLTRKQAFEGEDVSVILSTVLQREPDFDALPRELPERVSQVIKLCLRKDPRERPHDIGDVRLALGGAFETLAASAPNPAAPVGARFPWLWVAAALVLGGVATGVAMRLAAVAPPPQPVRRFQHTLPTTQTLPSSSGTLVAISPDGRLLVYRARDKGEFRLYRRSLGDLDVVAIRGTEGVSDAPFFSPDGKWLGFHINGVLMKVALAGGRPVRIGTLPRPTVRGATWGPDDSIVLGLHEAGLVKLPAAGGDAVSLTNSADGRALWYPQYLPGAHAILFTATQQAPDTGDLMVLDLASGKQQLVLRGGTAGRYTATGHLVFIRNGELWAIHFDPTRLVVSGEPALVEQGIRIEGGGAVQFAVADDGTLTYIPGANGGERRTLVWVSRDGREEPLAAPPRAYQYPRISPDGQRLALDVRDERFDIWIWNFVGQTLARLTTDPAFDQYPVWTPDGRRIVFASSRAKGFGNVYTQLADGTGPVERLTEGVHAQAPLTISPDGKTLVFVETATNGGTDLMRLSLDATSSQPTETAGRAGRNVQPLMQTPFQENNAELSPDGRWIAYQANDSGREQVYIRPFPDVNGGRFQVSTTGGRTPLWDRTGRALYYRAPNGAVMEVPVTSTSTWQNGLPTEIVPGGYYDAFGFGRTFDVAPDGKRFLVIKPASDQTAAPVIVVVTNWAEELERLLPAK